jgi:hypothetical protein
MQIISIDILILVAEVLLISDLKRRRPDFFFLGKGANIFLPP